MRIMIGKKSEVMRLRESWDLSKKKKRRDGCLRNVKFFVQMYQWTSVFR